MENPLKVMESCTCLLALGRRGKELPSAIMGRMGAARPGMGVCVRENHPMNTKVVLGWVVRVLTVVLESGGLRWGRGKNWLRPARGR